ncbi:FimV/HubP family polar landmark protein, partial [Legionella londiniensis]|uniref:FimV/HubP family polar landmark protein n=1 Tax=Legionella londiniensis TaxID=45068 RepID=UPI00399C735E
MKKVIFYTGLLCLIFPILAYALGLGDMTVHSYLNQPFDAEIKLIDAGNIPLSQVKANLASVEDFERIGLERAYVLDLLTFHIEKNDTGQPVIRIRSIERITEPYMEILVDLAWAEGQVYRAYTVLLDPPQYQLKTVKKFTPKISQAKSYDLPEHEEEETAFSHKEYIAEPKVQKRAAVTYGPTLAKETIWQIAQRYKTPDVSLHQVILAIVGANPEAFAEGNVNGLKQGVELTIPSPDTIKQVPETLAKLEISRHESAWQAQKPIDHVLMPPYYEGRTVQSEDTGSKEQILVSKVVKIPDFATVKTEKNGFFPAILSTTPAILSAQEDKQPGHPVQEKAQKDLIQAKMQAEMHVAQVAIESVRESNALLNRQILLLQENNQRLQHQLAKRDAELKRLQEEIRILRKGLAGQASALPETEEAHGFGFWLLWLILLAAGSGLIYWRWIRPIQARRSKEPEAKIIEQHREPLLPTMTPAELEEADTETAEIEDTNLQKGESELQETAEEAGETAGEFSEAERKAEDRASHVEEAAGLEKSLENRIETVKTELDDHVLEFEPGVDRLIEAKDEEAPSEVKEDKIDDSSIEYDISLVEPEIEPEIEPKIEPK